MEINGIPLVPFKPDDRKVRKIEINHNCTGQDDGIVLKNKHGEPLANVPIQYLAGRDSVRILKQLTDQTDGKTGVLGKELNFPA